MNKKNLPQREIKLGPRRQRIEDEWNKLSPEDKKRESSIWFPLKIRATIQDAKEHDRNEGGST